METNIGREWGRGERNGTNNGTKSIMHSWFADSTLVQHGNNRRRDGGGGGGRRGEDRGGEGGRRMRKQDH